VQQKLGTPTSSSLTRLVSCAVPYDQGGAFEASNFSKGDGW
jgi:hypothetical protein